MDVSIIIPIRNQSLFVEICLESIIKYTTVKYDIMLIDDDSNKETKDVLNKYSKYCELITNNEQKWLSYNWNLGAKLSKGKYICFLNSDTIVSKNWLEFLIEPFVELENIGLSGPTTSCCWGKQQHLKYHKNRFNLRNSVHKISEEVATQFENDKYEFIDVVGFCFLTDSKIFKENNIYFDETFKGPGNETDWILRIKEKSYKSIWAKKSYVHHFGRMSFNGDLGHEKAWNLWKEGDILLNKKYGRKISLVQ
jgi:GT2 family glycosyltransferase